MKHIKILISAVTIACVILGGSGIYISSKQLKIDFYENAEVNVNETVDNYQFIKRIANGTIVTERERVDTKSVGVRNVTLTVKPTFGAVRDFSYSILVVDHESPRITFANYLETIEGEEIDLFAGVHVTDNSNEHIPVRVEGIYDIQRAGEYELKYVACDSSSNKTEEKFILKVKAKDKPEDKAEIEPEEKPEDIPVPAPTPPPQTAPQPDDSQKDTTEPQPDREITFTTSKGFHGIIRNGVTYIDGYLIANKTYSLPQAYGNGLTAETQSTFDRMAAAAKEDGLNIYISSGFRSYSYQKNLYNNYVKRDGVAKADTYSARAGHSEHQSGLAFDVNIIGDAFIGTPEAIWLADNCYKYGFIVRYPQGKTNETGYKYEPWHFRHVGAELATILYNDGDWITIEDYFGITSEYQ